jgi:hypothetical protein
MTMSLGVVRKDTRHVAGVHRIGPVLDQSPNLLLVIRHPSAHPFHRGDSFRLVRSFGQDAIEIAS